MKQSFYIGKEPDLQKIIIASAVLHILFLFLITIPMKTNEKEYKSYVVDLVAPAEIQSHTNSSRSSMKASPRKRVKAKTMPSQRVNREIERLQAISAISKLKDRKKEEKANRLEVVKKNIYEGPDAAEVAGKIEALRQKKLGVAGIPGKAKPGKNTEFYYALITQKIWSEWICLNCESEDFEVVISFHINKDGSVDSLRVIRSSGNSFYDNSAMKAIRKASPLPPPVLEDDCEVRFRP
ncbi:MAG TPA: TonB C-terminal domain-containing protein [Nitrospirae bacterium]|nr:gram-negative bacterial tonB protein [bacterium BMS3Abin09]GBE41774.1 gram-negative bacterial tonB protein [bacterium BMS3Bbin09]HDH34447.1 TonB C-terminal domain-containing protein [Nitrospirota bacterium]HDN94991.1 TonB C-terminal domain-containing protein [Nitrospirota bacterium]HDZ83863.1 TonB C-terminal domain-containing protein [Nitrospirota bacterium]